MSGSKRTVFCEACKIKPSKTMKGCPACRKIYMSRASRRHYLANTELYKKRWAAWRKKNPEKQAAHTRAWRLRDPEGYYLSRKKYRKAKPEIFKMQSSRRYYGQFAEAHQMYMELKRQAMISIQGEKYANKNKDVQIARKTNSKQLAEPFMGNNAGRKRQKHSGKPGNGRSL